MKPAASRDAPAAQRWGQLFIGLLLVGCAAAIGLRFPLSDWKAMLAVALLLGAGVDALHAAWRARPSLLSRLGPLP